MKKNKSFLKLYLNICKPILFINNIQNSGLLLISFCLFAKIFNFLVAGDFKIVKRYGRS